MGIALAVGLAGAAGAVARYLIDGAVQDRTSGLFPYGTATVNVAGSFVLGLVTGLALHLPGSSDLHVVVGAGFCGGLTTWSAASWETLRLAEEGALGVAARFTALNLGASLLAGAAGLGLGLL